MTADPVPPLSDSDVRRFFGKVQQGGPTECWEWTGSRCGYHYREGRGYGQFGKGRQVWYAHRVAWTIAFGPIPSDLFVCHSCDHQGCVNPAHLFLGTALDNVKDCISKGRAARGLAKAVFGNRNGMNQPGIKEKHYRICQSEEWRRKVSEGTRAALQRKRQEAHL